jgi:adenylosuccinate lyase
MATENILMQAVARGGDRQALHERIRQHSHAAAAQLKECGERNDLLERLKIDPLFQDLDWTMLRAQEGYVGRAPEQVDEWISEQVGPVRQRYAHLLGQTAQLEV